MVRHGYVSPTFPAPHRSDDTEIIIYGYIPSIALAVIGCISFGSCAIAAVGLLYRFRPRWSWMTFATLIGTLFEITGYICRSLSSQVDPYRLAYFIIQYFFIVVAPVFFAAAIYLAFGRLIELVGSESSPVRPRLVFALFLAFDVVTTVVQVAGAAMIGTLESSHKDPTPANNILLAGLAIQTASFAVFLAILGLCVAKFSRLPKQATAFEDVKRYFVFLSLVAVLVQIRTTFRLAETAQNVFGYLSTHEAFFGCLEFLPIILAVAGLLWLSERLTDAAPPRSSSRSTEMSSVSSRV